MDERVDTPSEFPSSPAQAALDDTASRLSEALALVRRVARGFDQLAPDSRYRLSASIGRELHALSVAIGHDALTLADLGAGREPQTWDDFPIARRKRVKFDVKDIGTIATAGGTALGVATQMSGPTWVKVLVVVGGVLSALIARLTPHTPTPKQ